MENIPSLNLVSLVLWGCSTALHFSKNAICGSLFPDYSRDNGLEYFWLFKFILSIILHVYVRMGTGKFLDKINPKRHEED